MTLEAAVEALARALGRWRGPENGGDFDRRREFCPVGDAWTIEEAEDGDGFIVTKWWGEGNVDEWVRLRGREAMLWLRCGLLGTTRVRCPDCKGSKVGLVEHISHDMTRHEPIVHAFATPRPCPTCTGPAVECDSCTNGLEYRGYGDVGDCSACGGGGKVPGPSTGHVDRPWAEVLLGAMPRHAEPSGDRYLTKGEAEYSGGFGGKAGRAVSMGVGWRWADEIPGDPEARTLLSVKADEFMSPAHDPLDEARRSMVESKDRSDLGLWLRLWMERAPCDCPSHTHDENGCTRCAGSGLALGAHDRAMAEAGEQLAVGIQAAELRRADGPDRLGATVAL